MDQTTYIPIAAVCVVGGLIIIVPCIYMCTRKCESQLSGRRDHDQVPSNSDVENSGSDSATPKKDDMKQKMQILKAEIETVKENLEKQMSDVKRQLDEVDKEKKEKKEKLQEVEKELKKREENYDKPEELLKEKEALLHNEWRLDEIKRILEKQQSNLSMQMDLVETPLTRTTEILREVATQK